MKNLRVHTGDGAMVTWVNEQNEHIGLPLLCLDEEWKPTGIYLKFGTSRSDPAFAAVFPLPYNWEVPRRILRAIRRTHA